MWLIIGLALFAVAILAMRIAMMFSTRSKAPRPLRSFVMDQTFAVSLTGAFAVAVVLLADNILRGNLTTLSAWEWAAAAATLTLAVLGWIGLNRLAPRSETGQTAIVLTIPTIETPTPGTTTPRRPTRRLAA